MRLRCCTLWIGIILATGLLGSSPGLALEILKPERPVVIDPHPDWSSGWATRVCAFAQALAKFDPSFGPGAAAICAFVMGTE